MGLSTFKASTVGRAVRVPAGWVRSGRPSSGTAARAA